MINSKKKGFTIIELVIVIAVIAVLAAVLIPTFSSLVKKANMSADQQAVTQMNKALAVAEADTKINTPELMYDALEESGYNGKDYKPLAADMYFFWAKEVNRIVYVDKDNKVVFPTNLGEDANYAEGNWWSLSGDIVKEETPEINATGVATVTSAGELVALAEEYKKGTIANELKSIELSGNIDFMGAAVTFGNVGYSTELTISGPENGKAVLNNLRCEDATYVENGTEFNVGLINYVNDSSKIEFKNLEIVNAYVGDESKNNVGILLGQANKAVEITIENVTIKDSTVIGDKKVGALIGRTRGTLIGYKWSADPSTQAQNDVYKNESIVTLKNVVVENTKVYGKVEAEVGNIIGVAESSAGSVQNADKSQTYSYGVTQTVINEENCSFDGIEVIILK